MLRWFQALTPREEAFFDLFEAHARTLCAGARALRDLLRDLLRDRCADIARHEAKVDAVARDVLLAVREPTASWGASSTCHFG